MVAWLLDPQFKVEVDSTILSYDVFSVEVVLIENAVSLAKVLFNDYQSKNYIANIDLFSDLKVSLRYGSGAWTEKFCGIIEDTEPRLNEFGQVVVATAYGLERCLRNTHCNTSYGTESLNPTIDTPSEIWTDIVDNYVEKSFGGVATGYTLDLASNNGGSPTIQHLYNPYLSNLSILNQTLLFIQADRAGSSGHHWMVGTDGQLRIKRIGTDIAGWPSWWNTDEAGSTLVEGRDFISYGFSKRARGKDFANKVILTTDLRKPGYDHWCEYRGAGADSGSHLWGSDANIDLANANGAGFFVVGAYSLQATPNDDNIGTFWYPLAKNASWDLTKIGSENAPPFLGFYYRQTRTPTFISYIYLMTDAANYWSISTLPTGSIFAEIDKWVHLSLPVGPYHALFLDETGKRWNNNGGDWSNINWIEIGLAGTSSGEDCYTDDLHLGGKIIREAYNSTSIATYDEHQKIVRMNTAVDDSMVAADDSGTAAMLAYAELLTTQKIPITATLETPGIIDLLPGQFIHPHAAKKADGTFRIDDANFRVKQVNLTFKKNGFRTVTQVTDDLTNSFAKGPTELLSAYYKVVFTDPEAQSLRATGIDVLVPRLSVDYP